MPRLKAKNSLVQRVKINPTKHRPATEDDFRQDNKFKLNQTFLMKEENAEFLQGSFKTNQFMDLNDFKSLISKELVYVYL